MAEVGAQGSESLKGVGATTSVSPDSKRIGELLEQARRRIVPIEGGARELAANRGATHFTQNPSQDFVARFGGGGLSLRSTDGAPWSVALHYAGAGEQSVIGAQGTRVTYTHADGVTEWFDNRSDGIEHGFQLSTRLPGTGRRELKCRLDGMIASSEKDGPDLDWQTPDRGTALCYSDLKVWDAQGTTLAATMSPSEGGFTISIDDRDAAYPVFVDPVISRPLSRLNSLPIGDAEYADEFGKSVATDGARLIVGAWGDDQNRGDAYIFVKEEGEWYYETKLSPPGFMEPGDWFGEGVQIQGNVAVISAKGKTMDYEMAGTVYIYERINGEWTFRQRLVSSNHTGGQCFGSSLALDGNRILIGADGDNGWSQDSDEPGYAYIFEKQGEQWVETARLEEPTGMAGGHLGYSVALDGDTAFIGMPRKGAGEVLIFTKQGNSWAFATRLTGATAGDRFGHTVAADGGALVVGSVWAYSRKGKVQVFRGAGATWTPEAELVTSDGAVADWFGSAVAIDGNRILASAIFADLQFGQSYIFEKDGATWSQKAILHSRNGGFQGLSGQCVALHGDDAFCGAPEAYYLAGNYAGMVHWFQKKNGAWPSNSVALNAGDGDAHQNFGQSIDFAGDLAVVGMPRDWTPWAELAGTVYIFHRTGQDWEIEAILEDPTPIKLDRFGSVVDLDGDRLAVGVPGNVVFSTNPQDVTQYRYGAVMLFRRDTAGTWTVETQIKAADSVTDGSTNDEFGASLSLKGSTLLVGAPQASSVSTYVTGAFACGAGYVFRHNGTAWQQEAKLLPPNTQQYCGAGMSVAMENGRVYLGATTVSEIYSYVKPAAIWSYEATIKPAPREGNRQVGCSLALEGNTLAVGSWRTSIAEGGEAWVFSRSAPGSAWQEKQVLESPDRAMDETTGTGKKVTNFGTTVALANGLLVVTSTSDNPGGYFEAGSVHLFREIGGTWQRVQKLLSPEIMNEAHFGSAIATDGSTLMIGASGDAVVHPLTGDVAEGRGSVYIFEIGEGQMKLELRDMDDQVMEQDHEGFAFGIAEVGGFGGNQRLRVMSKGSMNLSGLQFSIAGPDAAHFELTGNTWNVPVPNLASLPPGEFVTIGVNFRPTSPGTKSAWIEIRSSDPLVPLRTVPLSGVGNQLPVASGKLFYGIQGRRVVIFVNDYAVDGDGDSIEFVEDDPTGSSAGVHSATKTELILEPNPSLTGTTPLSALVQDGHSSPAAIPGYVNLLPAAQVQLTGPVSRIAPNTLAVSLRGTPSTSYHIERSTDLTNWQRLGKLEADASGEVFFVHPGATGLKCFYRLVD